MTALVAAAGAARNCALLVVLLALAALFYADHAS